MATIAEKATIDQCTGDLVTIQGLLHMAQQVHDREVAELQAENAKLRKRSSETSQPLSNKSDFDRDRPTSSNHDVGQDDKAVIVQELELPHKWPILPVWDELPGLTQWLSVARTSTLSQQMQALPDDDGERVQDYDGMMKHFVSFPSSPPRLCWDIVGAVLIFYDLFSIPLYLAFNPPDADFSRGMDWFTLLFWTIDMFASLTVGFVKSGVTIMAPLQIALNYMKTWLMVDLLVVVPDWGFTVAALGSSKSSSSSSASSVKLLRTLRLVRMVRLLRLIKLKNILQNVDELIDSEYLSIVANIVKMILLLLVINHYIGCLWFIIGNSFDSSDTWIVYHEFDQVDWAYQYFTAIHWSITQFTPASMHVQPQNVVERIFAIAVVVFALVGFASVVGSITGSLAQLRSMQEEKSTQFWNLRRYLKQNRVYFELSVRIQRYIEHALHTHQEHMSVSKVKLFALLSEELNAELQYEMCASTLKIHGLFRHLHGVSKLTLHRLCNSSAISRKSLARTDTLFMHGEKATHMYIVEAGKLRYYKDQQSAVWVDKGEDWIAEPVLWTPVWTHLGMLTAVHECDLLLVEPRRFSEVIKVNPAAYMISCTYAENYLAWLNTVKLKELSDITQGEDVIQQVQDFCRVTS